MNLHTLGKKGEELAARFLEGKGYTILEKNFYRRTGEIDLIARAPDGTYVFAEVKTRRGHSCGYPEEAVTAKKIQKMVRVAELWLTLKGIHTDAIRLDAIAVEMRSPEPEIIHLENISS